MANFGNWQVTVVICTTLLTAILSQSEAFNYLNLVSEPLDQVFLENSGRRNVTFECSAVGNPAPEIVWMRNGTQVVENRKYQITVNGSLVISNVQRSDHGDFFWCKAENSFGAIRSRIATLEIAYMDNPIIRIAPTSSSFANKGLCLSCDLPDAYPGIEAKWRSASINDFLPASETRMVLTDGRLCFANVQYSDVGTYECFVANSYQPSPPSFQQSNSVTLRITSFGRNQVLQEVADVPTNVTVRQGEEAVLQCVFLSKPLPSLQWTRADGRPMASGVSSLTGYQLRIPNAQATDSGEYTCTATANSVSSTVTQYLTVKSPPVLTTGLTDTEVTMGNSASFRCVSDNPDDDYSWYKNAEPITFNRRVQRKSPTTMHIKSAGSGDAGIYQCSVSNRFGTVFSTAQLRVNGGMSGPGNKEPGNNKPGGNAGTGTGGNAAASLAGPTGLLLIMMVYHRFL